MKNKLEWLHDFAIDARRTDQLKGQANAVETLAMGLFGEAGSILAEVKKLRREGPVYVVQHERLREEIGDFLWYLVRLITILDPTMIGHLPQSPGGIRRGPLEKKLTAELRFGITVGEVMRTVRAKGRGPLKERAEAFVAVWRSLQEISKASGISLAEAAAANAEKRADRWPRSRSLPVFDEGFPEEERFPRRFEINFIERSKGGQYQVVLRGPGLNIGDRLTDSIGEPDGYRFHDVFHLGHAVFLGWSPVTRGLLLCKRKSNPAVDENEDGGRALVVEEAISAMVFGRAKQLDYFDGIPRLDYDLLKTIKEMARGYEVARVPLWQWEKAILSSYAIFRQLKESHGGRLFLDFERRSMTFRPPYAAR